jgi:TolB-like protein
MRMKTITLQILLAVLLLIPLGGRHALAGQVPSLAIMNFTNQTLDDPEWQWLSKGLADLLVTDLSRAKKFQVVDRDKIQGYLNEIDPAAAGIMAPKTALKIGKMARVEKALFGSFRVATRQIEIQTYIVDIKTQQVEQVERVRGQADDILDLEKTLALKIIDNLDVPLTQAEIDTIKFKATDSLDATTRFYGGLNAYDNGQYFDALKAFRLAEKKDPTYDKPLLFQGHVYENQGEYEHAILSYKSVAERAVNSAFADDGLFFAGKLAFEHFGRAKEALQLADHIINRYPNGLLPDNTQIMPTIRTHEAVIAMQHHRLPLKSYMHLFKYYIYLRTNRYQAALQALEAAETVIPSHRSHTYRTYFATCH